MEIEELRTFVEVADSGGISTAAARLGIAKSIVSRRLIRLESALGIRLLARNTRGASLTEAGVTFRDYAARVCAEIDAAQETLLPSGELRGRLRVAAPLSFGPTHFAPVLAEMAIRHPRLYIQTSYSDRFTDLISEGYDCAIRVGHLASSNLVAQRVGDVNGGLVASPAYVKAHGEPQTLDQLLEHETLMQGTQTWQLMDGDKVVSIRPQGRFKADNGIALVAAAVAGIGIGYFPFGLTRAYLASGALVTILPQHPSRPAGAFVVRPPGQNPARKIRVLTDMLKDYFREFPDFDLGVRQP
jgi:DNA-binding transcriptional LysR family regulator